MGNRRETARGSHPELHPYSDHEPGRHQALRLPGRHACSELAKLDHASQAEANKLFTLFRTWLRRQFTLLGREADADELAMHLLARSQGVATLANAFHDEKFIRREVEQMCDWLRSCAESAVASCRTRARRGLRRRKASDVRRAAQILRATKAKPASSWKATRNGSNAASMTASSCWSAVFKPNLGGGIVAHNTSLADLQSTGERRSVRRRRRRKRGNS